MSVSERKSGLFDRLMRLVDRVFTDSSHMLKEQQKLDGRIEEMRLNINRTILYLNAVKLEMELLDDKELNEHASSALDPLISDLKRYEAFEKETPEFNKWIKKASLWVRLTKNPLEKTGIIQTLIEHALSEAIDPIEQDMHVIKVYFHHRIHALGISDDQKEQMISQLEEEIRPHFEKLQILAHAFYPTTVAELLLHKGKIDREREACHEDLLSVIDEKLKPY